MVLESPVATEVGPSSAPEHIAIIMDGNGRWAEKRNLPRLAGHSAGIRNIHRIARACTDIGVKTLTVYAFSTENWERPEDEVSGLMTLFADASERETRDLHKNGVRVRHVGSMARVDPQLKEAIERAVQLTKDNTRITLNVAFNYGGRAEIVEAVKGIVAEGTPPEAIDEHLISSYLYTADTTDPDLVIRTAGEMRLSNFLIWQAAYSEYYSTPTLWPDFDEEDLRAAIDSYGSRQRKFGKL